MHVRVQRDERDCGDAPVHCARDGVPARATLAYGGKRGTKEVCTHRRRERSTRERRCERRCGRLLAVAFAGDWWERAPRCCRAQPLRLRPAACAKRWRRSQQIGRVAAVLAPRAPARRHRARVQLEPRPRTKGLSRSFQLRHVLPPCNLAPGRHHLRSQCAV